MEEETKRVVEEEYERMSKQKQEAEEILKVIEPEKRALEALLGKGRYTSKPKNKGRPKRETTEPTE